MYIQQYPFQICTIATMFCSFFIYQEVSQFLAISFGFIVAREKHYPFALLLKVLDISIITKSKKKIILVIKIFTQKSNSPCNCTFLQTFYLSLTCYGFCLIVNVLSVSLRLLVSVALQKYACSHMGTLRSQGQH